MLLEVSHVVNISEFALMSAARLFEFRACVSSVFHLVWVTVLTDCVVSEKSKTWRKERRRSDCSDACLPQWLDSNDWAASVGRWAYLLLYVNTAQYTVLVGHVHQ